MVKESQQWFLKLVADRRGIATATVPGLEDGRIYSGRQALSLKLVDEIGGEREAIAWLTASKGVETGLEVIDWKPKSDKRLELFDRQCEPRRPARGTCRASTWPRGSRKTG